jgi:hypothetical protein
MKRKSFVFITMILISLMFVPFSALAQNQGKIWHFGIGGGLNFNTNPPTPLPGSSISTWEGCATICDNSGNLFFYTDGISVWNRNHAVMPNGTGLLGNPSSAQSGIIVPDPGDANKYYVFEVSAWEVGGSNVWYSKVDMTLDGGLGDVEVTGKNSVLLLDTEEGIAAVPSSDATFWWIIVHKRGTSNFYAFRLTSAGIDTGSPVISTVGTATPANGVIGMIRSNAAGNRLAMTTYTAGWAEVYDFNNATGVISNPIHINHGAYGAEFSPNGNLLYLSSLDWMTFQYNLLAGSEALINSTRYMLTPNIAGNGGIQSAPDGKIYISVRNFSSLDVINNPNVIGAGCGYAQQAQTIAGTCRWGLPNIIASYVSTGPPQLDSLAHSNVTGTSATLSANVSTDGGETITARGFYYGTSPNPTGNQTLVAGTTGPMSANISGLTPGTPYYYRAFATNSNGTNSIGDGTFTTASPVVPTVTTAAVSNITSISADSGGNVTSDGGAAVTARGVCWSTSPNPTTAESTTSNGTGTGAFTSNITGLSPGVTYHVRAYATNSVGTSYGSDLMFTTAAVLPTVNTTVVSNITSTSADSGGNVTSDGGAAVTARGVCWSTSPNPTTADSTTSNGTGTGAFTSNMTGLSPGTTYHVRAYATNSVGTAYGSDITFTTNAVAPTVTTTAISNITSTTADSGGNVTDDGGAAVTARGICWSTNINPTTADSTTSNGTGTGAFTSNMTGLSPGTTYHVRAYATNSVGTSYGSDISFTANAVVPTVTTTAISNITSTTADSGGNVTDDGGAAVTARGVCWSTNVTPTTADSTTSNGTGTGAFTSNMTGLSPGTTYHVRAYATNSVGTSYGSDISFTANAIVPTVTTTAISNITSTTADSGGNVTDDGGAAVTARGVCWHTSSSPTITSNTFTIDGTGTGFFTSNITGLSPGTAYYVRAYATNSVGTAYGQEETFTAGVIIPTVTTTAVTGITSTTASSGGKVTDNGGSTVTARGVCWNTSPNPGISHNKTVDGTGSGSFTSDITGLMENTTYYVRAYATNTAGTGYGKQVKFTTNAESLTVTITEPRDGEQVSGTVTIKAAVTSNRAKAADASLMSVQKVEFYVDNTKIATDTDEPYETTWDTTTDSDGSHTIKAVAYNSANQSAQDEITVYVVNTPAEPSEILLNRIHLNYGSVPRADSASSSPGSTNLTTGAQTLLINNIGGGTLNWKVSKDAQWLSCTPETGIGPGAVDVTVDTTGLAPGTYNATITVEDPNAVNSPQTVPVNLTIYNSGTTTIPFGYFETPVDGSTVISSIPVTGWVLDDIDITSVKIYRAHIPGYEPVGLVYIGDAVMVDGARPDVEQRYPTYPKDYQAGWGYMMLTNFLPHQGNGTFTIYAKAMDKEGNEVILGSKTITCDNANAEKPFGAIDTPTQGGTASGSGFVNWGWALTPMPNMVPMDGSTIQVWVDGLPLGSPVYNKYREDIATLFPGYNNSEGAGGYFYLDTTAYMNGVHTIAWSVEDNAGNRDGIGSRYFTVLNVDTASSTSTVNGTGISRPTGKQPMLVGKSTLREARLSYEPVIVKKGYDRDTFGQALYPENTGIIFIGLKEDEPIEIVLSPASDSSSFSYGYMISGSRVQLLPIGSSLDNGRGIFSWQPGAGFLGLYRFVFVEKTAGGQYTKKLVNVKITPGDLQ